MIYIALLRGINVGGQKKIKMIDLKNMFESLSFKNVKTYLQSGNVIFHYETIDTMRLADKIEKKLIETFGFQVKVIILKSEELRNIINNNPFVKEPNIEPDKLHVTIFSDIPKPSMVKSLDVKKEENEKFLIISKVVYLYCPNGYGRTRLNNNIFEKKLNAFATTRNWKTINNLFEMSKQDSNIKLQP